MKKCVLIIVDVQNAIISEGPAYEGDFIACLKDSLKLADQYRIETIYVRHDDGVGSPLERGSQGWEIYDEIAPQKEVFVVDKVYNSAFHETDFDAYLKAKGYDTLIITGMQTEYCIDATVKSAFDLGYEIIIPEKGHTTMDNGLFKGQDMAVFFTDYIWRDRFAKILNLTEIEMILKGE